MPIDNRDFSILQCINDADTPLWKTRVHEKLIEHATQLPLESPMSLQTTARRIDTLRTEGYVDTTLFSAEDINRELVIGYEITSKGRKLLSDRRSTLLKQLVSIELFSNEEPFSITKQALAHLIHKEFNVSIPVENTVQHFTRHQLIILLAMYFLEKEADTAFENEQLEKFQATLREKIPPEHLIGS